MDEFTLIERYFSRHNADASGVALGIGDDAAVVELDPAYQMVIATDTVSSGTHFPPTMSPRAIGHRCLAVNLSDLAAMGAEPLWCTLALSLPSAEVDWLEAFSAGFFALADRFGVALIGGDTVRGPLAITVTVHGRVPRGRYVPRSGARPGDRVFVTGTPGDAAAGLALVDTSSNTPAAEVLRRRFSYPEPRIEAGLALRDVASAMIDVSDGLLIDLDRLARASGVGAELDTEFLPVSAQLCEWLGGAAATRLALTGGDDYELCFTVADTAAGGLDEIARDCGCDITPIGRIVAGAGIICLHNGEPMAIESRGFEHFPG